MKAYKTTTRKVNMRKIAIAFVIMLLIPVVNSFASVTVGDVVKHIPADVSVQAGASTTDLNKNIITLSFSLTSNLTNDVLSSITIDDTGTLPSGAADLKVYVNPLGRYSLRGARLVVSQASWNASNGTLNFSENVPLTQNTKAYVFISYDLRSTAASTTLLTSVSSMGLAAGSGSGSSVTVGQTSNTTSIVAKTACYDDVKLNQCGMCHNYQGYYQAFYPYSTTNTRKGHEKHVGLNRLECFICHNNSNRYLTYYTSIAPQHMDKSITVGPKIWDNVSSTGGAGVGYGTYNSGTRVCSNSYCHSNGSGTRVNSPAWGTAASGCTVCHATPPSTGAHSAHWTRITGLTSPADCAICHYGAGSGTFKHADGYINVLFDAAYNEKGSTASYDSGTKVCSNVRCHGGVNTPAWNAATGAYRQTVSGASYTSENNTWLKCEMCHTVDNISSGSETNVTKWNSARSAKHYAHVVVQAALLRSYTGTVNGTNFGRKRIRVSVCYVCHNNAHFNGTDYSWTKAAISDYHFSTNPGGTNNTIGGNAQRGGGTVGANIFDQYVDGSTSAIALGTTPTQNVYYMAAAGNYQSGTCNNTDCHGGGTWSYTATLDCTTCHAKVLNNKIANIVSEFYMSSHHVQGPTVNSQHCYKCHWEADNNSGTIIKNTTYHADGRSDLVIYDIATNTRPTVSNTATRTVFKPLSTLSQAGANLHCLSCHNENGKANQPFGDSKTPNQYSWDGSSINARFMTFKSYTSHIYNPATYNVVPTKIKTSSSHYYMQKHQRGVMVNATWANDASEPAAGAYTATNAGSVACLDCHNSHGSNLQYGNFGFSSYSSATGKYKGAILKQVWANLHGYRNNVPYSGYVAANYTPTEAYYVNNLGGANSGRSAIWSAQAALCFDCHLGEDTATGGVGAATTSMPRNYMQYGRAKGNIVAGYYDAINYEQAANNRQTIHGKGRWYIDNSNGGYSNTTNTTSPAYWVGEFQYKKGTIIGTHFQKHPGNTVTGFTPLNWKDSANSGNTNSNYLGQGKGMRGMCTYCHDPHGVNSMAGSPKLANIRYYSPQLKGMHLTALYYEDSAGEKYNATATYFTINLNGTNTITNQRGGPRFAPNRLLSRSPYIGNGYGRTTNNGATGFYIDDNTFGVTVNNGTNAIDLFSNTNYSLNMTSYWKTGNGTGVTFRTTGSVTTNSITEIDTQFGGLCLGCHPKTKLLGTRSSNSTRNKSFQTRAHRTVKGWGVYSSVDSGRAADIVPNYYINRLSGASGLNNAYTNTTNNINNIGLAPQGLYFNTAEGFYLRGDTSRGRAGMGFSWGLDFNKQVRQTGGNTNIQVGYHNFPCSKCHTPHQARLPRLLKTNCLDVWQSKDTSNNWSINTNVWKLKHSEKANNSMNNSRFSPSNVINNFNVANPATAVRCHNSPLVTSDTYQTRWNDITPWN